jgi:hypothetical protein
MVADWFTTHGSGAHVCYRRTDASHEEHGTTHDGKGDPCHENENMARRFVP